MSEKINIIVTGSGGQMGREFQSLFGNSEKYNVFFFSRKEWDINDPFFGEYVFSNYQPKVLINCAAYTNVDLAEEEKSSCFITNTESLKPLTSLCEIHNCLIIHFSTDYVFDGNKKTPYTLDDQTNPLNIYGESKLEGEKIIQESKANYCVIRTSWLYSIFGKNFVKTMLRLGEKLDEIKVITDQVASPTNGYYLAIATEKVIEKFLSDTEDFKSKIWHFTHTGECSWNDFAKEIFRISNIECVVNQTTTLEYGAQANRPQYSKLDDQIFCSEYQIQNLSWQEALTECLNKI